MWRSRAPSLQSPAYDDSIHSYTHTDTYGRGVCMSIFANCVVVHTLLSSETGGRVHLHLLSVAN